MVVYESRVQPSVSRAMVSYMCYPQKSRPSIIVTAASCAQIKPVQNAFTRAGFLFPQTVYDPSFSFARLEKIWSLHRTPPTPSPLPSSKAIPHQRVIPRPRTPNSTPPPSHARTILNPTPPTPAPPSVPRPQHAPDNPSSDDTTRPLHPRTKTRPQSASGSRPSTHPSS